MRISPFITLIFLFVLGACTKFEEGPGFSLRTRTNRIAGVWTIQSYEIDGIDSLHLLNFETHEYVFGGNKCGKNVYGRNCSQCPNITTKWQFSNPPNTISFTYGGAYSPFTYFDYSGTGYKSEIWTIMRLTNKEMILESYHDSFENSVRIIMTKGNNDRPCE